MDNRFECVIFVGIQGSGKSTFYKENFFRTHIRINLDMLKTRNRERILTEACFEAKQNFVVDNTNPTAENRKKYIKGAKKSGFKVIVYYFDTEYHTALKRNNSRSGKEKVPERAVLSTKNQMEKPRFEEGIDEIFTVITENNNIYVIKSDK
ncbi:ATP-binding protein [Sebaldella sp. S0638]|uniref:ATP-binding protein n=1 Tax=Sebaldella sp. S0638 TaxID=2957809 RepID=UPI00209C8108|nr:ATP-binding protein [Sebaldella sp. S0638]MCP1222793.1 ATP-binding protein [Sebaldella sp. S0638]